MDDTRAQLTHTLLYGFTNRAQHYPLKPCTYLCRSTRGFIEISAFTY